MHQWGWNIITHRWVSEMCTWSKRRHTRQRNYKVKQETWNTQPPQQNHDSYINKVIIVIVKFPFVQFEKYNFLSDEDDPVSYNILLFILLIGFATYVLEQMQSLSWLCTLAMIFPIKGGFLPQQKWSGWKLRTLITEIKVYILSP